MGKRRDRGGEQGPQDLGLRLRRGEPAACGLCGTVGPLSRTHLPPQCAGNNHGVQRHYLQTVDKDGMPTLVASRKRWRGGLYVFGLCAACNGAASRWDGAYGALARALRPCWSTGAVVVPGGRIAMPAVPVRASAVARSVLMGMFGVNRGLRDRYPDLARGLLDGAEPLALPEGLTLRVALAGGRTGRLTGAVHTYQVLDWKGGAGHPALLSDASVYFPPLAWQLADPASTLLDRQGWADASAWLSVKLDESPDLPSLVSSLPVVVDPTHDPALADALVHLMADELTPVVVCDGLAP